MSNFERSSKLRLSKENAKENFIFLFILERGYLRDKVVKIVRFVVRPSDRREEKSRGEQNKFIYFLFRDASYLRDKVVKIQLSEQNAKEKEQNVFEVFSD